MTVPLAVLCVHPYTVYHRFHGLNIYDHHRDARTWPGGTPLIAHPPCRAWSAFCRHQAKPAPGEADLGPLCVDLVTRWGGVLEHPAHSRLWHHCHLPRPGETAGRLTTIAVRQSAWGAETTKPTWLLLSGVPVPSPIPSPPTIEDGHRRWKLLSNARRTATTPAFAAWLIALARTADPELLPWATSATAKPTSPSSSR